jgi:desulfoferrodoxin-like iron-binding protein
VGAGPRSAENDICLATAHSYPIFFLAFQCLLADLARRLNGPAVTFVRVIGTGPLANTKEVIMTRKSDVYKCDECGCIVTVLKDGEGDLNCCEHKMLEVTPDEARKLTHAMARPGAP